MLNIVKKGDIVARKSYGKDVVFIIDRIIQNKIAILTGLTTRLQADAYLDDLEIVDKNEVEQIFNDINKKIVVSSSNNLEEKNSFFKRTNKIIYTGKILHLDGDKRYSEKSNMYYKKMGVKAIVRNIPENRQASVVNNLIYKYNPDILVVTGHDGMIKAGKSYEDMYNYRNSRYFVQTVKKARKNFSNKELVIFAGACQSYYEALIDAGANFASSPARILIDFVDPLVVATKVATTDTNKYLTIYDIEDELRDGERGINRDWCRWKKENIINMKIEPLGTHTFGLKFCAKGVRPQWLKMLQNYYKNVK